MASYWVFEPPGTQPGSEDAAAGAVLVRDGFSLWALLIPPIWALWNRLWLVFLAWAIVAVGLEALSRFVPHGDAMAGGLGAVFALWFALEGNALRAWTLGRKGYNLAAIVVGASRIEAEHHYLSSLPRLAQGPMGAGASSTAMPPLGGRDGVLGVFPEPALPRASWGTPT